MAQLDNAPTRDSVFNFIKSSNVFKNFERILIGLKRNLKKKLLRS